MKFNLFIICLFFALVTNVEVCAQVDTVQTEVLSSDKLFKLQKEKPFSEYINYTQQDKNLKAKIKRWLNWIFTKLFANRTSNTISNVLPYIIILLVVIIIALKFAGLNASILLKPSIKNKQGGSIYNENEHIQEVDFNKLIKRALETVDYRLAIRYTYLLLLSELDKKTIIEWGKHKSNYDYLIATKQTKFYQEFCFATRIYENAWYGEMPWNSDEFKLYFNKLNEQTATIKQKIKLN